MSHFDTYIEPYKSDFSTQELAHMRSMFDSIWTQAQELIGNGTPRGQVLSRLEHDSYALLRDVNKTFVLNAVSNAIERVLWDRNNQGRALEKDGAIDEAIVLYEANIIDQFDRPEPYDRLRMIYRKNKDYDNAIRVCQAALANLRFPHEREKFAEWIVKLSTAKRKRNIK